MGWGDFRSPPATTPATTTPASRATPAAAAPRQAPAAMAPAIPAATTLWGRAPCPRQQRANWAAAAAAAPPYTMAVGSGPIVNAPAAARNQTIPRRTRGPSVS
ncbi:MAG: hypothetical protein EXQ71_09435 [Acidimicrobiia bacterium]|nr:hypothetical protein [Acidimicrobiia bacterium]